MTTANGHDPELTHTDIASTAEPQLARPLSDRHRDGTPIRLITGYAESHTALVGGLLTWG
ncbi:hypothetical protein AB0M44_15420 [Streptosporangium subroseum]|uniref:hypothetical protein n=1 Tax=Streptosporangium subroseum TaxID=106412 RepID=UPI00344AD859